MFALADVAVNCPLCGEEVTLPSHAEMETDDGMVCAVVVTDKGTAWAHIRDAHPEDFARLVELQRAMNANPNISSMPRKVDGTFLMPGEGVGSI